MPDIFVHVAEKTAQAEGRPVIVCGNSDYTLHIRFDSEWEAYPLKTLRAAWRSGCRFFHTDVIFEGDKVQLPAFYDTPEVALGIYAGDIHTTTPVRIPCAQCITDGSPVIPPPPDDVYRQLLEYLENLEKGEAVTASDVQAVSAGGVSEGIIAVAEEAS
ncbi:MAG: hypothetical protein IKI58_08090 [Oscillospiraceae bacterium]|nr:hypothetical protein [Oscillospiraceae bacterium]